MSESEVDRLKRHCDELNHKTAKLGWFWFVGRRHDRHEVQRRDGAAPVL